MQTAQKMKIMEAAKNLTKNIFKSKKKVYQ